MPFITTESFFIVHTKLNFWQLQNSRSLQPTFLAPVVSRVHSTNHCINHYSLFNSIGWHSACSQADWDLWIGKQYPLDKSKWFWYSFTHMYKSIPYNYKSTPILEPKKISFSYFWVRIFLKNISFISEFSFRYAMVTRKICPELFFYLSFWPICKSRAIFWTDF